MSAFTTHIQTRKNNKKESSNLSLEYHTYSNSTIVAFVYMSAIFNILSYNIETLIFSWTYSYFYVLKTLHYYTECKTYNNKISSQLTYT